MTPVEMLELIGKIAGAVLGIFAVIASLVKCGEWIGARIAKFFDEKVSPPITQLTMSVKDLSEKTHENTVSMRSFAEEQRQINQDTAVKIAEVRGHLGFER